VIALNYSSIVIKKSDIRVLIRNLRDSYRLIGPVIEDGVIVLREMVLDELPAGAIDSQSPGKYRLLNKRDEEIFSFSNGPDSFKRFLYPSIKNLYYFKKTRKGLEIKIPDEDDKNFAFFGIRACDIKAMEILKKVFSDIKGHELTRRSPLIIGVNCSRPNENCFCHSLGSGPEIKNGADMVITELRDGLMIETGLDRIEFLEDIDYVEATEKEFIEKRTVIEGCKDRIKKSVHSGDLSGRIYRNLEDPRWKIVSERCLACGNCTQVCPTCFCTSTFDVIDIPSLKRSSEGLSGKRLRVWDSCFSTNFARVHGGNFRPSRRARYRHWLSHKFGYWIDQFGMIGCVGCGRCITWCPVGIDVTEELNSLGR